MIGTLAKLLNPAWEIRVGIVNEPTPRRAAVVAVRGERSVLLRTVRDSRRVMRWVWPLGVNSDCGLAAVRLVHDEIADTEPEVWVDRNEERLIPAGVTAEEVVTEWAATATAIHAATVSSKALAGSVRDVKGQRFVLRSLGVPLWDLARLYGGVIGEPFILWKLTPEGSVFGYVEDGRLGGLCSYWIGRDELAEADSATLEQLGAALGSLGRRGTRRVVMAFSGDDAGSGAEQIALPGYEVSGPPDIEGVSPEYHEAYALAAREATTLEFAPFADIEMVRTTGRRRRLALTTLRGAVAALALLFVGVGVLAGAAQVAQLMLAGRMEPIRADIMRLREQQRRVETLRDALMRKAGSIQRESIVTYLLSAFQETFPEGAWAEQIVVSERDSRRWSVDILAMTLSTAAVPDLLQRVQDIAGMRDVRLLYSEQTVVDPKARRKTRATRVKLEGVWEADKL
jgi:hypothetical protein